MTVCTLGFSRDNTARLAELLDGRHVLNCMFVVSDYYESKDATAFNELRDMLRQRSQTLLVARSHAKVALIEATDGRRFCIEGSMNFRGCFAYEQFLITTDRDVFANRQETMHQAAATAKGANDG